MTKQKQLKQRIAYGISMLDKARRKHAKRLPLIADLKALVKKDLKITAEALKRAHAAKSDTIDVAGHKRRKHVAEAA